MKMKRFLLFVMCLVLSLGAVGFVGCGNSADKPDVTSSNETVQNVSQADSQVQNNAGAGTAVQSVQLGGLVARSYASGNESDLRGSTAYLSKEITATVLPTTAPNKKVDFTVSWADDATLSDEDVSEYVTIEQASDGATTATVKCFKNFGDDKIAIRCTTRDGGFEATCLVSYVGIASDIEVENVSGAELKHDDSIGYYYEFLTNREYVFNFYGVNALGRASSDKIKYWSKGLNNSSGYYAFYFSGNAMNLYCNDDGPIKLSIDSTQFFSVTNSRNEDGSLQVRITVNDITLDTYNKDGNYILGAGSDNGGYVAGADSSTINSYRDENREKLDGHYFYVNAGWGHKETFLGIPYNVADVLGRVNFRIVSSN